MILTTCTIIVVVRYCTVRIVANTIILCHNLAPKDARPVNYFIQYAGLISETIHIKPD